ncbi:hypothetical protein EYR40_004541 [Pleurotus pulmonarius]|nr:hypothetical protein EYR38_001772 [Pleurotus pulmonarius]KAF4605751.1 hypothetical protein EYR40_004541 [Pleurotus pulmonarius]
MWATISTFSSTDRVLELLKRSQSAPLQILYLSTASAKPQAVNAILKQIGRVQELTLLLESSRDTQLLHQIGPTSAPILERLCLDSLGTPERFTLDMFFRDMPYLRHLQLSDILTSSGLPPLPSLESLILDRIELSPLLAFLRSSPKLKDIRIYDTFKNSPTAAPGPIVVLPNLMSIDITANYTRSSIILAYLEYPPSARVIFDNEDESPGEPDLSGLVQACRRLAERGALPISSITLGGGRCHFMLTVSSPDMQGEYLRFHLEVEPHYYPMVCLALCSALPVQDNSVMISFDYLEELTETQWRCAFHSLGQVHTLQLDHTTLHALAALLKSSSKEPPLSRLHTLHLYALKGLSDTLRNLLAERKQLSIPIMKVVLGYCPIPAEHVDELRGLAEVEWDGREEQ